MTRWYAIQVKPTAEKRVAEALGEYGVLTYVPIEKVVRRSAQNRRIPHERPLLRGYVIAAMPEDLHPMLHDIDGAMGVVSRNGRPLHASPWDLLRIWIEEQAGEFDKTPPVPKYRPGTRVHVRRGPFAGHIGVIHRLNSRRRASLILAMFGRPTPSTADLDDLEEVEEEAEQIDPKRAA